MAFLEGESLEERIAKGPLSLKDALDVARQAADGLEAAHEKAVVHRDVKPANIMVDAKGRATVMDFGLARLTEASRLTKVDTAMGTVAYMSPEQAQGMEVDYRTDIWALGCVLYEMVVGVRPFRGEYDQAVLYSILNEEPEPMTSLRTGVPIESESIVGKCLTKEKEDRYGAIAELGRDLRILADKLKSGTGHSRLEPQKLHSAAQERPIGWKQWVPLWSALAAGLLVAGLFWGFGGSDVPESDLVTRLHLNLPDLNQYAALRTVFTLSPNGRSLVFEANEMLYLREMGELDVSPIPGTEGGYGPFFSPDGEWLGFFTSSQLKKVSMQGGAPTTLANVANASTGVWSLNGDIIFGVRGPTGLKKISARGSEPVEDFTTPQEDEVDHNSLTLLPDGDTVVFGILLGDMIGWDGADIVAQSLTTGQRKLLISGVGGGAQFAASGHLIYARAGTLLAVPFDATRWEVTGEPTPVLEGVRHGMAAQFALTQDGTLAYIASAAGGGRSRALVWVDREGREQAVGLEPGVYYYPRIAPDGLSLAMSVAGQDLNIDILVYDLERGVLKRTLTEYLGADWGPIWSPDGKRVFHVSDEDGGKLVWKAVDGSSEGVLMETWLAPHSVSPDGSWLVYTEDNRESGRDIGVISLNGDATPRTLLGTQFLEDAAVISPDGQFLAYSSTESGRSEIYVSPFPAVDQDRWPVSRNGGTYPAWSRDGKELFYLNDGAMMAARRAASPDLSWNEPTELFSGDYVQSDVFERPYDVAPDGRFLMMKSVSGSRPGEITVVLNWFEELKRLVPTN